MSEKTPSRFELKVTGVGGQGVLVLGELLSRAGMSYYEHVAWLPGYGSAKRGGLCECTVVMDGEEIASPVLLHTDVVIVMDPSQITYSEPIVKAGGLMIVESEGLKKDIVTERDDIRVVKIPAVAIAMELGNPQASNLVLMGAYLGLTDVFPPELIDRELERWLADKEERVLNLNKEALRRGIQMGREAKETLP